MLHVLVVLPLALAPVQPCDSDADCINGTPRGIGHCSTPGRCEAPATVHRFYMPLV